MVCRTSVEMEANYTSRHEAFVSGHNGTTISEISAFTALGPASILLRNLAIPWIFPAKNFARGGICDKWLKFLLDFSLSILPTVLCYSVLSDAIRAVLVIECLAAFSLLLFAICEYLYLYRDKPLLGDVLSSSLDGRTKPFYITYFRAYTLIATSVAILAVDFPVFPRRLAKTETFGYGLMDTGVGIFVLANALTGPEIRRPRERASRKILMSVPLVVLGFVRLIVVKLVGYQEHTSEYGLHWNFFFTLAAVKILCALLSSCLPLSRIAGAVSVFLAITHQYLLDHWGLASILLYGSIGDSARKDLFDANREGLISVVGYLALYLAGLRLGSWLLKPRVRLNVWFKLCVQLMLLSVMFGILLYCCDMYVARASRRMANLTYIVWILFLCVQNLTLLLAIELLILFGTAMKWPLHTVGDSPFDQLEPCLWSRINKRPLLHFLFANILTGVVNFAIRTLETPDDLATVFLIVYSSVLSLVLFVLR